MNIRDIEQQLRQILFYLFALILLHTAAMVLFERMHLGDALWLTLTSATTVGYGDLSAQTFMGRMSTVVLLYLGGIALLAQSAGLYFEYRQARIAKIVLGFWSWNMHDHIVFLNCPHEGGEEYYFRAINQIRNSNCEHSHLPIIVVSDKFPEGLTDRLRDMDVVLVNAIISDPEVYKKASVIQARKIIIHAQNHSDAISDSITFDIIDRLRLMGCKAKIVAESVLDENRPRLRKAGADHVIRPIRVYPEMLARAIIAPGSEVVLETLFNYQGDECIRLDVKVTRVWQDIVMMFLKNDFGLPVAYQKENGTVVNNPPAREKAKCEAIFAIVSEENVLRRDEMIEFFEMTSE